MSFRFPAPRALCAVALAAVSLFACTDRSPTHPDPTDRIDPQAPPGTNLLVALDCVASTRRATVECGQLETSDGVQAAIFGGQNVNVRLTSSNVGYDSGSGIFTFDVTVQNLLREAMGTPDGATPDPDGIRVFFKTPPTTTGGTGSVTVANADGTDNFTATGQSYFQYDELLTTNQQSAARTWRLAAPSSVETFSFQVYISTTVQHLLVINEVLVNPGGGVADADGQWLEIYNAGSLKVDLQGYLIEAIGIHEISTHLVVPPEGYVVLGANANTSVNGGAPVDYAYGAGLALGGGNSGLVQLERVFGGTDTLTIDEVAYASPAISAQDGTSRELIDPTLDNLDMDACEWGDALASAVYGPGGRGTPGAANSNTVDSTCAAGFLIELLGGTDSIPDQTLDEPFALRVTALDASDAWDTDFDGTVLVRIVGLAGSENAIGTSGPFVNGVHGNLPITITGSTDSVAIIVGTGSVADTSNFFVVDSGSVSLGTDTVDLGVASTRTLGATALNADGSPSTLTVEWSSDDETVATVDAAGVVTAVAVGVANITASAGPSRFATKEVGVCPTLAVGQVLDSEVPFDPFLCVLGGASGNAEYTFMPSNMSTASSLSLSVTGTDIVAVTGPPSPVAGMEGALDYLESMAVNQAANDSAHLAQLEQSSLDVSGAEALALFTGRAHIERIVTPGVPTVGDLWDLNVAQGCSGALDMRVGMVRTVGEHVIIVADTANPPGGFTTAQYDSIALEVDTIAYPVDTINFGGPTDLDSNGRFVVFFTRAVNELSPPSSSFVNLGYFASRDLFSSAPTSCPRSNEGEMIYAMVPDPTGAVNSNVRLVSFVRGNMVGNIGHELQHLINASRRLYIHSSVSLEETWLDEGLSHIAEELMFYRTSMGLAPRGNIVTTQLTTGPNATRRIAAFNAYANPNFGRMRSWLQRPDTTGPYSTSASLAARGTLWAFLRYASDRVNGSDTDFWNSLVNTTATGLANLESAIGGADPKDWVRDWVTSMYADDAVSGVQNQYKNPSWNYRSLYIALNNGTYTLVPRPLTDGTTITLSHGRGGSTAYYRFGVASGNPARLTALSGGVAPSTPYGWQLIRTK